MKCKYGCGKEIKEEDFDLIDERVMSDDTIKRIRNRKTPHQFKLYYEIDDDGDMGDLHMCPELQKLIDDPNYLGDNGIPILRAARPKIWKLTNEEDKRKLNDWLMQKVDFVFEELKKEGISQKELQNAIDKITDSGKRKALDCLKPEECKEDDNEKSLLKLDVDEFLYTEVEINSEVFNNEEKLEEKLFQLLGCMKCHNIFYPIVELGNLYNRRGEYSIAKRLFDIVLQWNRYEPISSLGKAEAYLQSGMDIKSAEASLFDLNDIYDQLGGEKDGDPMLNKTTQGFTMYDKHFVRAKIDYLRAIVSMRWKKNTKSKKLLMDAIKKIDDNFISQRFGKKRSQEEIEELSSESENKRVWEFVKKQSLGAYIIIRFFQVASGAVEPFFVFPHMNLYKHAVNTFSELASQPGNESMLLEAENFSKNLSGFRSKFKEIQRDITNAQEKEIEIIDERCKEQGIEPALNALVSENCIYLTRAEIEKYSIDPMDEIENLKVRKEELEDLIVELEESISLTGEWDWEGEDDEYEKTKIEFEQQGSEDVSYLEDQLDSANEELEDIKNQIENLEVLKLADVVEYQFDNEMINRFGDAWRESSPEELDYWKFQKEIWKAMSYQGRLPEVISNRRKILQLIKEKLPEEKIKHKRSDDWNVLMESIKQDGQNEPIKVTPQGEILDGRRRLEVCEFLGIEPKKIVVDIKEYQEIGTPTISPKQLTVDDRIAEIEFAFRKLIKRKLSGEKNWERTLIPFYVYTKANERLEDDENGEYATKGLEWLDELEVKDYGKIFCGHCKVCNYEKKKKFHDIKFCKKSNWDLYFKKVFGLSPIILKGDLDRFRLIRNPVGHHRGQKIGEYLNEMQREDLTRLYTRWNKVICDDEDTSKLV